MNTEKAKALINRLPEMTGNSEPFEIRQQLCKTLFGHSKESPPYVQPGTGKLMSLVHNSKPVSTKELFDRLQDSTGHCVVMAETSYCGTEEHARFHFFALKGSILQPLFDALIHKNEVESITVSLATHHNLALGSSDAMAQTCPVFTWAEVDGMLHLWHLKKVRALISAEGIDFYGLLGRRHINKGSITAISRDIGAGWLRRSVAIQLNIRKIQLVTKWDLAPLSDPTYDGLDLMGDTLWMDSLVAATSQKLGLPPCG